MLDSEKTLFALLRSAIGEYSEEINLNNKELIKVMFMSQAQGVSALTVDGLQKYLSKRPQLHPFEKETSVEKLRRMQWIGQVMALEKLYAKHKISMVHLAQIYATQGIRMMVLKGYGLSLDWPIPNHRVVGDLDIYNFGKWKEADDWVKKKCGIKIDDEHEHHTLFNFNGISVENHYDFINTKAHRDAPKIEKYLKQLAKKNCKEIEVQGTKIYLPSAQFNAIFLMRHMGQHFAGEHLNLRQVLDWGFFVRAHSHEVNWSAAISFIKQIGLYAFFNQINAICVDYLGFSTTYFPSIKRKSVLEKRILADVLHPEFAEVKPQKGLRRILAFKMRRWWQNRWKHTLVYDEPLLLQFFTLLLSHLRRYKTIQD